MILLGQVKLNGKTVYELGAKADPATDTISVDGKVINPVQQTKFYYALNKPRGYICTTDDPQGRPTVMDLIAKIPHRVYPVGRLDYASEGLLLFTNDGDTAHKLMHPSSEVIRRYAVKVRGYVSDLKLQKLRDGLQLTEAFIKPAKVERGSKLLSEKEWIFIELKEGKNMEIRRLFQLIGHEVDRLRRVSIGPIKVDRVPVGQFRPLRASEVKSIFQAQQNPKELKKKVRRKITPHSSRRGH